MTRAGSPSAISVSPAPSTSSLRAATAADPRLFRLHAQRAVETDRLAVQHRIADDIEDQPGIFLRPAEALREGHRFAEALLHLGWQARHQRRGEEPGRDGVDADAHGREFARR